MPEPFEEPGEREDADSGGIEVLERVGQFPIDVVQQPVELGMRGIGIGLVVDGVHTADHIVFGVTDIRSAA